MAHTENKRTERINLRIQTSMMEKLNVVAADMGMPASTIATYALGEYVNKYFSTKKMQTDIVTSVENQVSGMFTSMMSDPSIQKLIASTEERDDDQLTLGGV